MKKLTKKFFCPVNDWDCPCWKKDDGSCSMVDDGDDPVENCDDAAPWWDYDEAEDYESPFIWEDENGARWDMQELLEQGYHFVNGEPVKPDLDPELVKMAQEILASPPMGMKNIKIRNPNWEG